MSNAYTILLVCVSGTQSWLNTSIHVIVFLIRVLLSNTIMTIMIVSGALKPIDWKLFEKESWRGITDCSDSHVSNIRCLVNCLLA